MKQQEIIFKKPVKVIQVFRNINVYDKTLKSFEDRKDSFEWKEISSKSGYVQSGELFLPEQISDDPIFSDCGLITIEDDKLPTVIPSYEVRYIMPPASNAVAPNNRCFKFPGTNELDIFKIKIAEQIELHLNYSYFGIGIPERENFKICELILHKPVEIKINGKIDSSLSSRRGRAFKEQAYIFEFIGEFNSCKILKEPFEPVKKRVPEERKLIDLLKPLW